MSATSLSATADTRKGLTWSKKWHIVDESKSHDRYDVAVCGAYLYNAENERASFRGGRFPDHLQDVVDGRRKSTGECKLCNKAVGRQTVTVELPNLQPNRQKVPSWRLDPLITVTARRAALYTRPVGIETIDGPPISLSVDDARALAGAILAAADAAEATHG